VYLFGSRARGTERAQSDYDLVAVAAAFVTVSRFRRCLDRDSLWLDAGGWRQPLDLHCYTPEEFRREKVGLGYLGQAHRRGELLRIAPAPRREETGIPTVRPDPIEDERDHQGPAEAERQFPAP
jgi:hypothetical protein